VVVGVKEVKLKNISLKHYLVGLTALPTHLLLTELNLRLGSTSR